jgi:hypothetical protein
MRTLHLNKGKGKNLKNKFLVLDVETNGLNANPENFIFCCLYSFDNALFFYKVDEIKKELLKAKYRNKIVFVHFAEFDLNVIYRNIITGLDNAAIYSGSNFICATNGNVKFADSLNIYKTSVKNIGESIGLKKLDIEQSYLKGNVKKITDNMLIYCKRDCEIVFEGLLSIFNFVGSVKITLASLSLALFKNKYLKYNIEYEPTYTDLFRKSYYGGRTEVFKIGKCNANYYDINSMYPFCMLKNFPNPKKFKVEKNISVKRFLSLIEFYEGVANIELLHEDHYFGFLPVKNENKLLFPTGNIKGWYNLNEIRFALENNVIKIKKIHEIYYSPQIMLSPFNQFVTDLYKIKNESEGITKYNAKILMNSLYGKFAEKDSTINTYYENLPVNLIQKYDILDIPYKIHLFNKIRNDCYIEVATEKGKNKSHQIPLFSSYITSYARIELLKYLLKYKECEPLYCDTDSIFFNKLPDIKDSTEIGLFKREKEIITKIYGLKDYEYKKDDDDKIYKKIKGIPLKNATQINTNNYSFKAMIKSKQSLRRNNKTGNHILITKNLTRNYNKRKILTNFGTMPIKLT